MLTNENPLTPEQVEEEYLNYAESLRWQILQQTVAEAIDLKVTAEGSKARPNAWSAPNTRNTACPWTRTPLPTSRKTC